MCFRNLNIKKHIIPFLIITIIALVINVQYLKEPPAYIHAWSQADNYSLAIGFTHNKHDLFHPQTMIYNKQQKGFDDPISLVTACDLPLHHWIAGVLMSITGSKEPCIFRGLTLVVSIIGMLGLYLLAFLLTGSIEKSLFVATFTATTPSFAYYSASFLPTIPAMSLAIFGLLFYVVYLQKHRQGPLYVSLLLLTLSMMSRTSFAILWVAVACFQVLRIMRREVSFQSSWLPFTIGAILFASWWIWNAYLRQKYGSLFLSRLLPVRNMDDVHFVFKNIHDRWRFHYFERMQHWFFAIAIIGAVLTRLLKVKTKSDNTKKLSLWWFLAIWFLGEFAFAIAMFQQYSDHDYYFLDSFFLPIVALLIGLLSLTPNVTKRWSHITVFFMVLMLTCFMTIESCNMQKERRTQGVEALETAIHYGNANDILDKLGYRERDLRFLALFAYPQNTPFTMMDREGYVVMWNNPSIVEHALTFDFDYILIEDASYRREFDEAKYILPYLKRLGGDGNISVCTLSDSLLHTTMEDFFDSNTNPS